MLFFFFKKICTRAIYYVAYCGQNEVGGNISQQAKKKKSLFKSLKKKVDN